MKDADVKILDEKLKDTDLSIERRKDESARRPGNSAARHTQVNNSI